MSKVATEQDLEGIEKLLSYDPDTGIIFYIKACPPRGYKGKVVTSLDSHGYIRVSYKGRRYSGHRVAYYLMTGKLPDDDIDHINGDRKDNRWVNLREASRSENLRRQKKTRGKSKYKGVAKHKSGWVAQCRDTKLCVSAYIGISKSEEEAALMYNHAAEKLFGKYARFNRVFEDMPKEVIDGET